MMEKIIVIIYLFVGLAWPKTVNWEKLETTASYKWVMITEMPKDSLYSKFDHRKIIYFFDEAKETVGVLLTQEELKIFNAENK